MLVAVEGIDKTGKSTLVKKLHRKLHNSYTTQEPQSGTLTGEMCRKILKSQTYSEVDALAFAMDRVDHFKRLKHLINYPDFYVITDRYKMSSLAYQSAQGLDIEWLKQINSQAPEPDLTIYIDIPVDVAIMRIQDEAEDLREKFEEKQMLIKVKRQYEKILKHYEPTVFIVDYDDKNMVDKILSFMKFL